MIARARPVVDRVDRDGEAVVLVADRAVRLSAVATAAVDACPDWTDADDLAARLTRRFGPPPGADAARAARAVLAELAREGLVELGDDRSVTTSGSLLPTLPRPDRRPDDDVPAGSAPDDPRGPMTET